MPDIDADRLTELSKLQLPGARGNLVDWARSVRAWNGHIDNCPGLYRTLAYETFKQWLDNIPVDTEMKGECLQWLIKKIQP